MILADKIIQLRKQLGWSQEELAEKMAVSRQSVSKWESTQSIPDLNKIVKLADLFGVSTDFLIKDEVETAEFIEGDSESSVREVSLEQGLGYIDAKLAIANLTAKGAALCACAPIPLMFLLAMWSSGQSSLTDQTAAAFGIVAILVIVAIGVSFFVRMKQYEAETSQIENDKFELSYGVHGVITEKQKAFQPVYNRRLSIGVGMFIASVIPFLLVALLSGRQDLTLLMLAVLFLLVAAGIYIVIPVSAQSEAYQLLLSEGDRDAGKSETTRNAEKLGAFYWPLLVAIYLGWSFWTMSWGVTWIVFPVGAVAFAALLGLMGLLKKEGAR